jgi:arylformamidase
MVWWYREGTTVMSDWIDISTPLRNGMAHWPGDRPFELRCESGMSQGAEYNLSSFSTSAHVGTHMDAPLHFLAGGASMDALPLDVVIGRARVLGIQDPERIRTRELDGYRIQAGERILFRTANSRRAWGDEPFDTRFVAFAAEAAEYLAQIRPALVGVDYLSVGAFESDGAETHRALLGAGIWVVEGLNLHHVQPGEYELVCLPLRMAGAEGAPARAALRRV